MSGDKTNHQWYAHSGNGGNRWHLLREHLSCVAELAERFAAGTSWSEESAFSGQAHDLGKYGCLFPDRLQGRESGLDHWSAGAWVALKDFHAVAAALAIQGHHIGLQRGDPDSLRALDPGRLAEHHPFCLRLTEPEPENLLRRAREDGLNFESPDVVCLDPAKFRTTPVGSMLDVRLLYSCLVDADFLDTEAHFMGERDGKKYRISGPSLVPERAVEALERFMEEKVRPGTLEESDVTEARNRLWKMMEEAAGSPPGLYTLTAPTGSGKTLAMLRFALDHARSNNLQRIILVVPYLSIIEQTAAVYRAVFKDFPEHFILEHHSMAGIGSEEGYTPARESTEYARRLLAENWDAPIILTTNVQFLESLFSNRPSACRKLHNLMRAVIMFDEAQALPPSLAVPTLATLSHLVTRYRSTVVFATATQPAFDVLHDHVRKHVAVGWQPVEIAPDHAALYDNLRRYKVHWPGTGETITWEDLAGSLREHQQALCVVNLKKHAHALLTEFEHTDHVFHLSTNLCPLHRRAVLRQVRDRLQREKTCLLISTQCIEAGVDVDFPLLYRAMAPLDAIAQAAGRCNREGRLADHDGRLRPGEVRVFEPGETGGWRSRYPSYEYFQAAEVTRSMLLKAGPAGLDLGDPATFRAYYRSLYDLSRPESRNEELTEAIKRMDFVAVAQYYRIIDQNTIQVLVPYGPQAELFDELCMIAEEEGIDAAWMRRAQGLAVSIYRPARDHPAWEVLAPARLRYGNQDAFSDEWFILQQSGEGIYDELLGLQLPQSRQLLIA